MHTNLKDLSKLIGKRDWHQTHLRCKGRPLCICDNIIINKTKQKRLSRLLGDMQATEGHHNIHFQLATVLRVGALN
jgi:hypothetical protein